jgi:putative glutamine amidotransferase
MKPLIGITTYLGEKNTINSVSFYYINAIHMAGAIPVNLPIINDEACIEVYMEILDGVLFTGGVDIAPYYYGENPINQLGKISSRRDEFELSLFKRAYEKNIPILGICKGIQLINVALGGNLYQDIPTQIPSSLGHGPSGIGVDELYHSVKIKRESKLYGIIGEEETLVNSFHHQSIKTLGGNLMASAFSEDGVIEAVESLDDKFLVGVQWHPECLVKRYPEFLTLFNGFVYAAARYKQDKA